ncbi:hypothetical protein KIH39_26075 [Telmatocola sphagniphila]|uniref:Uncharacterized protein n=1 Tax=Telmatocola sphagniphila TaxID=1123043 RepID=A0A8E6B6M4_9BACT|nr:hypothetical protein [Telmatocola sphagniphila]QVL32259.1 hypothetical protein KIH39_26075 [Telmatocola sphagniphila]
MVANILHEFGGRGIGTITGMILGGGLTFLVGRWRRRKERLSVIHGDARDTVVIHLHQVETREVINPNDGSIREVPDVVRIRALGQAEMRRVIPNGHLADILLHRAKSVTPTNTIISMEGIEGSYLLETLTGFVCDRTANAPFEHDLYVMAPCCEPKELSRHQPISIILIRKKHLLMFRDWKDVRMVKVEHSNEGARILTLMQMALRFDAEQERISLMRAEGKRVTYEETMYLLDLALDDRTASLPIKPIPWGRFEKVLLSLNLE